MRVRGSSCSSSSGTIATDSSRLTSHLTNYETPLEKSENRKHVPKWEKSRTITESERKKSGAT